GDGECWRDSELGRTGPAQAESGWDRDPRLRGWQLPSCARFGQPGGGFPYATAVPTQPWFAITSVHAEKAWLLSRARGAFCKTFRPRRCAAAMAASLGLPVGCCRLERRASRLARPRSR